MLLIITDLPQRPGIDARERGVALRHSERGGPRGAG
jgi:hypothetical protein